MRLAHSLLLACLIILGSCLNNNNTTEELSKSKDDHGKTALQKAIKQHGGELYDSAYYQFEFRNKIYTFHNQGNQYTYTRTQTTEGDTILDTLCDEGFKRWINNVEQTLSDSNVTLFSESLNSVIYFATLPHKLTDPAVNTHYLGTQTIKAKTYNMVQVTFAQENGGTDFEDTYLYWINKADNTIDYLAYNYTVNDGGVRFRSAYNRRIIEGIYFQDYINFKAPVGTPLDSLTLMYEQNSLEELSRIETEKVVSLN
jgi:hypothetical protein